MCRRPLLVLLVALSLATPGFAPRGSAAQPEPPVFSSEVSLVLLPVFVVDRHGHAVRGLRPEDFSVLEDGRRVEVASFRYVDTTAPEEQEELKEQSAARRRFLLLFDESFTDPAGLHRAQRAAVQFVLARLKESDLAGVATFDTNRGVRIVANFTEDRGLLAHAIETLGVPSLAQISDPLGLAADANAADLSRTPALGQSEQQPQALLDSVLAVLARRAQAAEDEQYRAKIETLISGFDALAKGLREVDGRKQVLYFSAGFDSRVLVGQQGEDQRQAAQAVTEGRLWDVDSWTRYGDSRLRELLEEMTRRLTRSDSVLHAVDVTGLGGGVSLDRISVSPDSPRDNPGREALHFLSEETGGRLFKNANDLGPALDEMLEMTSRYYVLGFQPAKSDGPGSYHKIRVRVDRKNVKLSHRAGYYEKLPVAAQTVLQHQFEAAQLVMAGGSHDALPFSSLCLPFPQPGDRQTLGLVLQVPKESLRWEAGRTLKLEAYGYAVAEDGSVLDHMAKQVRLDLAELDPRGDARGVSFFGALAVPPGNYTLRLMVRDDESGAAGVQLMDIKVPPYDARVGFLLPPVVMDDVGRWLNLEVGHASGGRERPSFPFEVAGRAFLPRASFALEPGRPERLVLFAYEPARPGDPAADLQISTTLSDRQGKPVRPGAVRIDRVDRDPAGRRTFVLGYTPSALPEGDYTLRVGVGQGGSLLEAYSLVRVRPPS